MTVEVTGDRGPAIGPSIVQLPPYEDVFITGVGIARRKLRRLPADLVVVDGTRLSDYEQSSLKRLAAMNAWAEEYDVTLHDHELSLLSGTTVGRLVSFMQRKKSMLEAGVELTSDELEGLRARAITPPEELPAPEDIAAHKLVMNRMSDETADALLAAMNAKLTP